MAKTTRTARDVLREVSSTQGWTRDTEISVLCDFIDYVQDGPDNPDSCFLVDEFRIWLDRRIESEASM